MYALTLTKGGTSRRPLFILLLASIVIFEPLLYVVSVIAVPSILYSNPDDKLLSVLKVVDCVDSIYLNTDRLLSLSCT